MPRTPHSATADPAPKPPLPRAQQRTLAEPSAEVAGPPRPDHPQPTTRVTAASGAGAASDPSEGVAEAAQVRRPDADPRSLVYSGLLGLVISLTGLGMVMVRRRRW